ncbi:melatonin receptor type 1B-B-like [Gigantopelta aegis]|uniref:melatonin receptor type 1B-B-like n=1 Tax=Gigantopelta aegis TaxID=1735272 RepID=UPI001B88BB47|nr:melatonin receptor type 1B-B-like [Gigantopelta aegis]
MATLDINNESVVFSRHEFLYTEPGIAIPVIVVVAVAALIGTFGNILILLAVITQKSLHTIESVFIVNLACSDMYVTTFADPLSLTAKLEGEQFFNSIPGLCRAVGSMCTISCVNSLMSIAAMSFNRFFFICHNKYYKTVFTVRNCIIMCACFYSIGLILVLLNLGDIGGHSFDRKSLECIWDRMATYPYTVVFSIVLVWVPIIITGASYLKMFLHVRSVRAKVHQTRTTNGVANGPTRTPSFQLAKTLFVIYIVFSVCWIPYALLIVLDKDNTVSHELHVGIVVWAHLHPSLNWLVYYYTNKKFHRAFLSLLCINKCCPSAVVGDATMVSETRMQPSTIAVSGSNGKKMKEIKESSGI